MWVVACPASCWAVLVGRSRFEGSVLEVLRGFPGSERGRRRCPSVHKTATGCRCPPDVPRTPSRLPLTVPSYKAVAADSLPFMTGRSQFEESTALIVEGCHFAPPWAVGTPSPFRVSAIALRLSP
jgi:hypothetical protein